MKKITEPTGVNLRKLEQRYMKEQREVEEDHQAQQHPWLLNDISFCYDRELPANNDNKKKHFLQHKEKHKNIKEAYTDGLKSIGKMVSFAAVFTDITRRGLCLKKLQFKNL